MTDDFRYGKRNSCAAGVVDILLSDVAANGMSKQQYYKDITQIVFIFKSATMSDFFAVR